MPWSGGSSYSWQCMVTGAVCIWKKRTVCTVLAYYALINYHIHKYAVPM